MLSHKHRTTMSKGLLKRWHGEEAMGGAYIAFRVLFQLLATFAIIVRPCFVGPASLVGF